MDETKLFASLSLYSAARRAEVVFDQSMQEDELTELLKKADLPTDGNRKGESQQTAAE